MAFNKTLDSHNFFQKIFLQRCNLSSCLITVRHWIPLSSSIYCEPSKKAILIFFFKKCSRLHWNDFGTFIFNFTSSACLTFVKILRLFLEASLSRNTFYKGKKFCRWLVKVHHSLKQSGVITCAGHIVGWGQKRRRVRWDEHCSHICRVISPPFSQLQDISVSSQNVFKLTFILNLDVDS